jgi:hypothetical protein
MNEAGGLAQNPACMLEDETPITRKIISAQGCCGTYSVAKKSKFNAANRSSERVELLYEFFHVSPRESPLIVFHYNNSFKKKIHLGKT